MLKLLERTIATLEDRLVLLAPPDAAPSFFRHVEIDTDRHQRLVHEMQQLRGRIYLNDGAIRPQQLSADGAHQTPEDNKSWHLLSIDGAQKVTGCAWYLQHNQGVKPQTLRVRHSPLARNQDWRELLWKGVNAELDRAHRERLNYVEVGGWAVAKEAACPTEGLVIALAGYSLGQICGDCLGMTTATVRHCSSSILRRLGGAPLEVSGIRVPSYYDPRYECEMEILRFDSRKPNPRYASLVARLRNAMANVRVIAMPAQPTVAEHVSYSKPWIENGSLTYGHRAHA